MQIKSLAARAAASVREIAEDATPWPMTLEELRMTLPSVGCAYPRCRNMATPAEDTLGTLLCAKCGVIQYCSTACQKAHWPVHKAACQSRP